VFKLQKSGGFSVQVSGFWLLVTGCWLLETGYWPEASGGIETDSRHKK